MNLMNSNTLTSSLQKVTFGVDIKHVQLVLLTNQSIKYASQVEICRKKYVWTTCQACIITPNQNLAYAPTFSATVLDVNRSCTNLAALQEASDKTGHFLPTSSQILKDHTNKSDLYRTLVHQIVCES